MKKTLLLVVLLAGCLCTTQACKKKRGICYCSYYSGDKTEYDLRDLSRSEQKDSCAVLNTLAANFVGHCKLK